MLIEGLVATISADDGVKALLGARTDSGVYPMLAPAGVRMPYISFQEVPGGEMLDETMQGTGPLQSARFRFSCYGSTYLSAKKLAKALKSALLDLGGPLDTGDVFISGAYCVMEVDDAEPIPHGTIYATHLDFNFVFIDDMTAQKVTP